MESAAYRRRVSLFKMAAHELDVFSLTDIAEIQQAYAQIHLHEVGIKLIDHEEHKCVTKLDMKPYWSYFPSMSTCHFGDMSSLRCIDFHVNNNSENESAM